MSLCLSVYHMYALGMDGNVNRMNDLFSADSGNGIIRSDINHNHVTDDMMERLLHHILMNETSHASSQPVAETMINSLPR